VPFVDVLPTMLGASLPLTPPEWLEWGDPIHDKAAFETIRAYSPIDNLRAQHYPAILALAGLTDPRVTYWEPAKWVARLRATMTGGGPILLRTAMDAGHAGASGRHRLHRGRTLGVKTQTVGPVSHPLRTFRPERLTLADRRGVASADCNDGPRPRMLHGEALQHPPRRAGIGHSVAPALDPR
jgi:Prolyl oligopeptidase family